MQSLHPHLFDDFQHHDCSEFMNLLLDQLNTECRAFYGMEVAEGSGETSSQKVVTSILTYPLSYNITSKLYNN